MRYYELKREAILMIWEYEPTKRNINNKIAFCAREDFFITAGDVLFAHPTEMLTSAYKVTEILEKRPARVTGMFYYIARSEWSQIPVTDILKNKNSTLTDIMKLKCERIIENDAENR